MSVDLGSGQRDKVTLRFLDPSLEVAYQADTAEAARRLLTWACLVNAPIWFVGALLAPVVLGVDPDAGLGRRARSRSSSCCPGRCLRYGVRGAA